MLGFIGRHSDASAIGFDWVAVGLAGTFFGKK
jgi:hypothetical protein